VGLFAANEDDPENRNAQLNGIHIWNRMVNAGY
jgi:hypothetical protein